MAIESEERLLRPILLRYLLILSSLIAGFAVADWVLTQPYPLLSGSVGVNWEYQNADAIVSQFAVPAVQLSSFQVHYDAWVSGVADKSRCSIYFVLAGPGEGKSRLLTGPISFFRLCSTCLRS